MNRAILTGGVIGFAAGCGAGAGEEHVKPEVAVHVEPIARATMRRYVTGYGTVEPEPAAAGRPAAGAVISPIQPGVLAAIDVVEGQRVQQGAVLFRLESRLAEVTVGKAKQEVEFAEQAYRRQEELLQSEVTSKRAVQEAKQRLDAARGDLSAAETALVYLHIAAPLSGTVLRMNARVGQSVDAATVLASVVDLNRLVVSVNVPSHEAAGIKAGQRVFIGTDTVSAKGSVALVGHDVDPANDTYRVLVSIPAGSGLSPGSFTDIRIVAEEHRNVLVVPIAGLVTSSGEGSWLMVVRGDSAIKVPVTAGLRDRGLVEVSGEGVAEGQKAVTVEAYSLPGNIKVTTAGR